MPGFQQPMTFGDFVERENTADMRSQLTLVHKFRCLRKNSPVTFRPDPVDARRSHEFKDQCCAQPEQLLRNSIRWRSHTRDQPSIRSKTIQRAVEGFAADCVEYYRQPASIRFKLHPFNEILLHVIDDNIGPQFATESD